MRTTPVLAIVSTLLFCTPAWTQLAEQTPMAAQNVQDGRRPVFGRVLDKRGAPVTGAEVYLVSNLVAGLPELGGNDEIRLESDARGRFRARLLPGRGYSAWAWASRKDGSQWFSLVQDEVRPGPALDLHMIPSRARPALQLAAAAGGISYKKVFYHLGGKHFVLRELAGVETGSAVLPRLAGDRTVLRLFDEKARPLQERRLTLTTWNPDIPIKLVPRTPAMVRIQVLDGTKAVPDVQVMLTMTNWRGRLATTDKNGEASFVLEGYVNARTKKFRASREFLLIKAGYPATLLRFEGKQGEEANLPRVSIQFAQSRRLEGRLVDATGQPKAGVPLALYSATERDRRGRRSTTFFLQPLVARTDSDGRFALAGLSTKSAHRLLALPVDGGPPILLSSSATPPVSDLLLGNLQSTDFVRLDLNVTDHTNRPVPNARLVLGEAGSKRTDRQGLTYPFYLFPDRRGRAQLLLRKGLLPAFAAAWQGGLTEVTPDLTNTGKGPISVPLQLPVLVRINGQFTCADHQTFPGATIRAYISRRPGALKLTNILSSILPQPVRMDGSFEVYVRPGAKVMLQAFYNDPNGNVPKAWHGNVPYAVYEEDTANIQIPLKVGSSKNRRQVIQIGIGLGK